MRVDQFIEQAERGTPARHPVLERLIECWATPGEFLRLPGLLADRSLGQFADHLAAGALFRFLADSPEIRQFERMDRGQDVTLYASADTGLPDRARGLVVAFAASGGRLTLPCAAFLQSIRDPEFDVLLLRDPYRNHFRNGCPGFGGDFLSLARKVWGIGRDYGRVVALGTSMGGLPAVRFALLARSGAAISIGGRRWNDVARVAEARAGLPPYDPICACLEAGHPDLLYVHAADHVKDAQEAQALADLTGGRVLPVTSVATHHVLGELWKRHSLPEFLQGILQPR